MKLKSIFQLILLIVFLHVLTSCTSHKDTTSKSAENTSTIEDFDVFYDRFHSDSVFQVSRIKYPLQGLRFDGTEEMKWTKDNFGLVTTRIYDVDTTEYKISYKKTEKEFIQKVWIENSGFWSEYKFRLIDDKWFLVSAVEQDI